MFNVKVFLKRIGVNHQIIGMLMLSIIWASILLSSLMDTMNILVFFTVIVFWLTRNETVCPKLVASLSKWFLVVFICFFGLSFISLILNESNLEAWYEQFRQRVAVLIAVGLLSILLIKLKLKESVLWLSLIAVFVSLVIAIYLEWQVMESIVFSGTYRFGQIKGSTSSPLIFGVIANLITALLLGALIWAYRHSSWFLVAVYIFASLLSIYAAFLSGTRGAWLGLPEILIGWMIFVYFSILKKISIQKQIFTIVVFFVVFISLILLSEDKLFKRISFAIQDIEQYMDNKPIGSIGIRLVMYEAALDGIVDKPFSGVGIDKVSVEMEQRTQMVLLERFDIESFGYATSDVHNQYLQELFVRGVLGLLGLLIVQFYLMVFFIKRSNVNNVFAVAGVIFVLASMINMLSYSWLRFHGGMFFYFITTTFLIYGATLKSDLDKKDA